MKLKSVKTKLPKGLKRIIILKSDANHTLSGGADRIVVGKKKKKKKKQSKGLVRVWERLARRSAKGNETTSDAYLSRHRRSNRKRRDGWLRDFGYNMARARRKGNKKIKFSKIFKW